MSGSAKLPLSAALSAFSVAVTEVKALGDRKHGAMTWSALDPREFLEAGTRHLAEIAAGRLIDNESGLPHAAHVAVNMEYLHATHVDFHASAPPLVTSLRAREVYRWHTVPVVRPQTLADHSYAVATIARRLLQILNRPDLIPQAIEAALDHDIAETVHGDVPSPAKGATGGFGRYWSASDPLWRRVVRVADKLEAYTYVRAFGVGKLAIAAEMLYKDWIAGIAHASNDGWEPMSYAVRAVLAEAGRDPPTTATQEEANRWERK